MPGPLHPSRLAQRLEDGYFVAVLLLVLGWLVPLMHSLAVGSIAFDAGEAVQEGARALALQEGTPLFQALIGACYVVSGVAVLRRVRPGTLPLAVLLPAGLVVLALVSWLWSESPDITLRRAIGLAGTAMVAFHLGWSCDWPRLSRLLGLALGLACATSIAASLLFPSWAVHHGGDHDGDWRGLFIQKNSAGTAMVLGLLAAAAGLATDWPRRRWWSLALAAVAVAGVVGSGSRTAWFLAALAAAIAVWVLLLRQRGSAAVVVALVTIALAAAAAYAVYDVFASAPRPEDVHVLGRDLTATGRYTLWNALGPYIAERPLAGYGFRGFWSGQGPCLELWTAVGWEPANAHSSWIDTMLELGAIGVALVVALVAAYLARLWRGWRDLAAGQAIWALGLIALITIQGLSDTTLLEPNGPLWTLTLLTFFHLLRPPGAAAPGTAP